MKQCSVHLTLTCASWARLVSRTDDLLV
jgi:hypothetical protein